MGNPELRFGSPVSSYDTGMMQIVLQQHAKRFLASFCAAVALALSGCAAIQASAENETDIRVIDLKITGTGPYGWVDNETFVVTMQTGESYVRKDGAEVPIARVATINYRTGERKLFGKASTPICFSDGYISYMFADGATGRLWASYGRLGNETTVPIAKGGIYFDVVGGTCRPSTELPKRPEWAEGGLAVWNLRPKDGVINCNTGGVYGSDQWRKAKFHSPGDAIGVELPFACYSVRFRLKYYSFRDAYFSPHHASVVPWPVGKDRNVYWLFPNGRVETILLPYSSAVRGRMVPTSRGIVAFSRPVSRTEAHGVYLVTPQSEKRIFIGQATGVTSPDGCKVAVLHYPEFSATSGVRHRARADASFRVLELC